MLYNHSNCQSSWIQDRHLKTLIEYMVVFIQETIISPHPPSVWSVTSLMSLGVSSTTWQQFASYLEVHIRWHWGDLHLLFLDSSLVSLPQGSVLIPLLFSAYALSVKLYTVPSHPVMMMTLILLVFQQTYQYLIIINNQLNLTYLSSKTNKNLHINKASRATFGWISKPVGFLTWLDHLAFNSLL